MNVGSPSIVIAVKDKTQNRYSKVADAGPANYDSAQQYSNLNTKIIEQVN
jgi:hypothetical protein